jgi:hypothetical protein
MKKIVNKTLFVLATIFSLQAHAQNVGIGTDSAVQKLHVAGSAYITDNVGAAVANPVYKLDVGGRMRLRSVSNTSTSAGMWLNNTNNTSKVAFIGMQADDFVGFYSSSLNNFGFGMNTQNGNVGIGTNYPVYKLDVAGRIRLRSLTNQPSGLPGIWFNKLQNGLSPAALIGMYNSSIMGVYGLQNSAWTLASNLDLGFVGIGTVAPSAKLQVAGTIKATGNIKAGDKTNIGIEYVRNTGTMQVSQKGEFFCTCPAGKKAINGGGGQVIFANESRLINLNGSGPVADGSGWRVLLYNESGNQTLPIEIWAVCVKFQ